MRTLTVQLGPLSYPVYIGAGLLTDKDLVSRHVTGRQVLVVSNSTVAPLYMDRLTGSLDGFDISTYVIPDGEMYKNLDVLQGIFDHMLEVPCNRSCTVVALGGGVVGDITGFAAHR